MADDKALLDWLDAEAPVMIERDGATVLIIDSDSGNEMGRGPTVRDAIWQAMRGDAV